MADPNQHDPGDAVPPGVAPAEPPAPSEEDKAVLEKLRHERDRKGRDEKPGSVRDEGHRR